VKWSATEGLLPTISSAGQVAVANVAAAVEHELNCVGEGALAEGRGGETLRTRRILHGAALRAILA
jgi:hypothetical protein